jgi:SulP family sulfate permease
LVLIPQSMAYAQLAGLPPYLGLWAGVLPPVLAALFASSPYLQTGPVAMTSLLTLGALSAFAAPTTEEFIGLAALLALVVGVVRLGLGAIRGGFLAYFMSQPVLKGFTSAAAILITLTQVPTLLGVPGGAGGIVLGAVDALRHPASWHVPSALLGLGTIGLVLGARRLHPLMPGILVAVVGALLFSALSDFSGPTLGSIPISLPDHVGSLPWRMLPALIVPGGVIALVGFAEPAAIARVFAEQDRTPWSPNREFVSQGVANLAAGLSGAFPVGGSFSRSSVARLAGARSRWTGAVTGVVVLSFLPFAGVLEGLPRAVLGGIVIAAVAELIQFRPLMAMVRDSRLQAGVGWITFALTLVLAPRVDIAVLAGVGLAGVAHLWRELLIEVRTSRDGDALRIAPVGVLFFASAPPLDDAIVTELARHPDASKLVLDLSHLGRIDYTGALVMRRIIREAGRAGVDLRLSGIPAHATRVLRAVLGEDFERLKTADGE